MTPVVPLSIQLAARSSALRGSYLAVFVELHEWLDEEEYRTVKPWHLATRLHMGQSNVYEALDCLVAQGFLEYGPSLDKSRTYRLTTPHQRVA